MNSARSPQSPWLFIGVVFVCSAYLFSLLPAGSVGRAPPGAVVTVAVASALHTFLAALFFFVWLFFRRSRRLLFLTLACVFGGTLELFNLLTEPDLFVSSPSIYSLCLSGYGASAALMVIFVALYFNAVCDGLIDGHDIDSRALRFTGRAASVLSFFLAVTFPLGVALVAAGSPWVAVNDIAKRLVCGAIVAFTLFRLCRAWLLFPDASARPAVAAAIVYGTGGIRDLVVLSYSGTQGLSLHGVAAGSAAMGMILFVGIAMEYAAGQRRLAEWNSELEASVATRTRDLEESNEKLKRLEAQRREMIANIAHDLRTPVTVISGAIQLLERPGGDSAPLVEIAAERSRQLADRVRDLFALAQMEAGGIELHCVRTSARRLLSDFYEHYATEFSPQSGDPVKISLDMPEEDREVEADFERLWQVFDNLVTNARRHMKTDPELRFFLRFTKDEAVFGVEDNGEGIRPADLEHVFERFWRGSSGGGGGLGLAIARTIVELHNGRIWVESEPDRGSRFSFALPLAG